jgi:hypothetical protein
VSYDTVATIVSFTYDEYFGGSTEVARTMMYRDSLTLANESFPGGVGLGRFGGHVAFTEYSPLYYELGYHRVYGLVPGEGGYVTDTFWPALLGQSGWFGAGAYLTGLAALGLFGWRASRDVAAERRLLGLVTVGWSTVYLVESVASPVYSSPPAFALLFAAAGMLVGLKSTDDPDPGRELPSRQLVASN